LLENWLVYLTILSPLIAFALWHIKLNGKKWCILTTSLAFATTVYLSYNPPTITNVTYWLPYYSLFFMIYILLLLPKYGTAQFNKIMACAIFMLFIAGDLWELPVFIYDFVGKGFVADSVWWFSHIRRLYTLGVFVLFTQLAQTHYRKPMIIADAVFGSCLLMIMLLPSMIQSYSFLSTVARIFTLALFGSMTIEAL
jgi:hypothetical protein